MGQQSSNSANMTNKTLVTNETSNHPIVVFVSSGCPYCTTVTRELSGHGYDAKVIQASQEQRAALREMTGSSSVPNCWVRGQFVGGCNDGPESWMGITKMIKSGKLDALLKA